MKASRTGWMTISTTDWRRFVRPDNGMIPFVFDGSPSNELIFATPHLSYLDDCNIVMQWLEKENTIGMSITSDETFAKQLCDLAIGGILTGHAKAAQ